jgi:hypothetical protein
MSLVPKVYTRMEELTRFKGTVKETKFVSTGSPGYRKPRDRNYARISLQSKNAPHQASAA